MLTGTCDDQPIEIEFDLNEAFEMIKKYSGIEPSIGLEELKEILDRGGTIQINHFFICDKEKRKERKKAETDKIKESEG